jgi:NADH dehydrogenase FAD-containing subunit
MASEVARRRVVIVGAGFGGLAAARALRKAPVAVTVVDRRRRRILTAFERAERERDPEQQRALLTFVLVGGGPTGVELAGAISEIARRTLTRDFRHIQPESARVFLLEAVPRVLPGYVESLSDAARRQAAPDPAERSVKLEGPDPGPCSRWRARRRATSRPPS